MKAIKNLQSKSAAELVNLKKEAHDGMKKFSFALAGSKTKNVREGRAHRKQIARINTLQRQNHA